MNRNPLLSNRSMVGLHRKFKRGDMKARAELVKRNQGLVWHIAKQVYGRSQNVHISDLVGEGNIGLLEGINRFKEGKGAQFSTYAGLWIKCYMLRASMEQAGPFRLTTNRMRKVWWQYGKVMRELNHEGFVPTVQNMAERLGASEEDVRTVAIHRGGFHASIDAINRDGDDVQDHASFMADPNSDHGERLERAEWVKVNGDRLREAMSKLSPRERKVIEMRKLLDEPMTLDQAGRAAGMNVSRERCRQIELEAMNKIQAAMRKWARAA